MPCFSPMPAVQFGNRVVMISRDRKIRLLKGEKLDSSLKELELPCGKCLGCRLEYARQWAQRIMFEAKAWPEDSNWFVTLTYADDHLPPAADPVTGELDGASLEPKHLQDFMKRVREFWSRVKGVEPVRFYAAGEYGDRRARPHYHVCFFNLPLDDLRFWKLSGSGFPLYVSETLSKQWPFGFVEIEDLTPGNAAYCARYVVKKAKINVDYRALGVKPEFVRMSRRPGIGFRYLSDHLDKIYRDDLVYLPSGGHQRPAKYFDRKAGDLGLDLSDTKERREAVRKIYDNLKPPICPEDYYRDLEEREFLLSQRFKVFSR